MEIRPDTSSIAYKIQKGILHPEEYQRAYRELKPKDTAVTAIRKAVEKIMHRKQDYEAIASILKIGYRSDLERLKAAKIIPFSSDLYEHVVNDTARINLVEVTPEERMKNMFGLTRLKVRWYQNNERVPWYLIGCIHYRESNEQDKPLGDTYLGDGESLRHRSTRVPKGEPKISPGPPFGFQEASVYAIAKHLKHTGHWQLRTILEAALEWNGNGYLKHGVNSPYLWGGSQYYDTGYFIGDHNYRGGERDKSMGIACILKEMEQSGRISICHG